MGQRSSRCKQVKNAFGNVHFDRHVAPPQTFTGFWTAESNPHLSGAGEEDGAKKKKKKRTKEDTFKKKKSFRLWKWTSCLSGGQKYTKRTSSTQDEEENRGTEVLDDPDSVQQVICTVEHHSCQESSASDHEVCCEAEEHLAVVPNADALHTSVWRGSVAQTSVVSTSHWNSDFALTPVHCTSSDWSINVTQTATRKVSDWSTRSGVQHTTSDWSIDIPVSTDSGAGCSDWSADAAQTPARAASVWSVDVVQTPVSSTDVSVSGQVENNGKMKTRVINSCHYVIGDVLGEGNFGVVYEGYRLLDGFKVAVKYVTKTEEVEYISIPGHSKPLPVEVALLILANKDHSVPEIIQLLDWQDLGDHFIMVLERPSPCEDLFGFTERHGGKIDEGLARVVMRQATQAAYMCCCHGVLHRDIKLENLLINIQTHEVKLIDFGCGDLLKKSPYRTFTGTDEYRPPEFDEKGEYNGKPATVWSLGVLLFALISGDYPNTDDLQEINVNNFSRAGLTYECCHLISSCLQRNPEQRLQLSEILLHNWFKVTNVENLR